MVYSVETSRKVSSTGGDGGVSLGWLIQFYSSVCAPYNCLLRRTSTVEKSVLEVRKGVTWMAYYCEQWVKSCGDGSGDTVYKDSLSLFIIN
jgi:hypothetical protein